MINLVCSCIVCGKYQANYTIGICHVCLFLCYLRLIGFCTIRFYRYRSFNDLCGRNISGHGFWDYVITKSKLIECSAAKEKYFAAPIFSIIGLCSPLYNFDVFLLSVWAKHANPLCWKRYRNHRNSIINKIFITI